MRENLKRVRLAAVMLLLALVLSGCGSLGKGMTDSASAKNLNMDGYVMYGVVETNNPETATPEGKLMIGRLTYKSRKVGIPAGQKVPTTGYFKATKTKSLFGTEEVIIEYDFTAGSDADAQTARDALDKKMEQAIKMKSGNADAVESSGTGMNTSGASGTSDGTGNADSGTGK